MIAGDFCRAIRCRFPHPEVLRWLGGFQYQLFSLLSRRAAFGHKRKKNDTSKVAISNC